MKLFLRLFLILSKFLIPCSLWGEDKKTSIESFYRYEYHQTLGSDHELFFRGEKKIGSYLKVRGGFSTGFQSFPERFFLAVELNNLPAFLSYRLNLLTRDFSDEGIREICLAPRLTFLSPYFEGEFGINFKTIRMMWDKSHTVNFLYRVQINILKLKHYNLSYSFANFDDFRGGNIAGLYHYIKNYFPISDNLTIRLFVPFHSAGQTMFAGNLTSVSGELGVIYKL